MCCMKNYFKIVKKSGISKARLSELNTAHGAIHGPFFMTIATRGAVKNVSVDEMKNLGAEIILSNTYHLLLRPGVALMKKYGGLHKFMNWSGPILTDSGGYQVFSLGKHRKIIEQGVRFNDPQNGNAYFLTPESAIQIQNVIGSDIMMALDECPPYPSTEAYSKESLLRTTRWAQRCKKEMIKIKKKDTRAKKRLLFGIVQGSVYEGLRKESARAITSIDLDGYAIGGVAVGEPREAMKQVLYWVVPHLPENKPRYLMGLGRPDEIVYAVREGIDMFDCVIPTREARHGRLYTWNKQQTFQSWLKNPNKKSFYSTIDIGKAKFSHDLTPINKDNLSMYSKAYLHHLFRTNEGLGLRLASLHNISFYFDLMRKIRNCIKEGKL